MANIAKFRRTGTRREPGSISGLFFTMPRPQQARRIRELSRTFSTEQISSIVHLSCREVQALIEGAA